MKNEKVLKAITIGISAMITATSMPITALAAEPADGVDDSNSNTITADAQSTAVTAEVQEMSKTAESNVEDADKSIAAVREILADSNPKEECPNSAKKLTARAEGTATSDSNSLRRAEDKNITAAKDYIDQANASIELIEAARQVIDNKATLVDAKKTAADNALTEVETKKLEADEIKNNVDSADSTQLTAASEYNTAYSNAETKASAANDVVDEITKLVDDASDKVDELQKNFDAATSSADMQKVEDELQKLSDDTEKTLQEKLTAYATAEQEYKDALAKIEECEKDYESKLEAYNKLVADYNDKLGEYNNSVATYNTAAGDYNTAKANHNTAIETNNEQMTAARDALNKAKSELNSANNKVSAFLAEAENAKKEVAELTQDAVSIETMKSNLLELYKKNNGMVWQDVKGFEKGSTCADNLFAMYVRYYYIPSTDNADKAQNITIERVKGTAGGDYNYFTVSYVDNNNNTVTKYLNYKFGDGQYGTTMSEDTPLVVFEKDLTAVVCDKAAKDALALKNDQGGKLLEKVDKNQIMTYSDAENNTYVVILNTSRDKAVARYLVAEDGSITNCGISENATVTYTNYKFYMQDGEIHTVNTFDSQWENYKNDAKNGTSNFQGHTTAEQNYVDYATKNTDLKNNYDNLYNAAVKAQEDLTKASDYVETIRETIKNTLRVSVSKNTISADDLSIKERADDLSTKEAVTKAIANIAKLKEDALAKAREAKAAIDKKLKDNEDKIKEKIADENRRTPAPSDSTPVADDTTPAVVDDTTPAPAVVAGVATPGVPVVSPVAIPTVAAAPRAARAAAATPAVANAAAAEQAAEAVENAATPAAAEQAAEVVNIGENEVPLSANPFEDESGVMNWWWTLIVAVFGAAGFELYRKYGMNKLAKKDIDKKND